MEARGTGSTEIAGERRPLGAARKRKGGWPCTAPLPAAPGACAHPDTYFIWPIQACCLCLQLGNLLGKPDTRAWCSVLHSPLAPPRCLGSVEFKGSRPWVHLDPTDTANSMCSHSNLLTFKGKACLLEHWVLSLQCR